MKNSGRKLAAIAALTVMGWGNGTMAAQASAQSTPERNASFAKIPNWRGFWEIHDIGASGTPDPREVARITGGAPPAFTDAWIVRMKSETKHNPLTDRVCSFGFPTLVESSPLIFEFLSVPEETVMVFNGRELRHIYTDGRGHTPEDVRLTTPWGDSYGRWDGDTLVVETTATNGLFRFTNAEGKRDSTTLSETAVFTEKLRMIDANTLEDSVVVADPAALREPYHFTRAFHRIPNFYRVPEELDCETSGTNDRNPIVDGKYTLAPPKE